jgi:hypothetical protein
MARSAKGASRTVTEAVKTLKHCPESPFTEEDIAEAAKVIVSNLKATRQVGTARSGFKEIPDDATRQKAAETIFKLGLHEVTATQSQTEAQTEEDSSPKRAAPASELPINPELERRILQDRLEVLDKSAETARN